ncbi:MAG: 3-phosphoshikimate 1-carboxyvinyltransferase [Clostridia bacterium]|nr:3-phosphoshikimate 1-carboxyvinyltransferase [Clostridia bacterium]
MNVTIHPGRLSGAVRVPASKSAAHRALIAAALSDGLTTVHIDALNDDIEATLDCLAALGALIDYDERRGRLIVRPVDGAPGLKRHLQGLAGKASAHVDYAEPLDLDCGESGSTLRFLLPVACALGADARFTGRGRLPERPNRALTEALRAHGAAIDADTLPMNVRGGLAGGLWALPGDVSSQYVTGLLFALPLLREDSVIRLTTPLQSAGYVDMTLQTLADFGIGVVPAENGWRVPGNQAYRTPEDVFVEGDWSAAAFWLAANAMGSEVDVTGVSRRTAQGDRAIEDLLGKAMIDASNVPDLVPALAAAAAVLPQRTVITGAARLRLKESDRLRAVADMLTALGGAVEVVPDGLVIDGGRPLTGGKVDGCNDHRIVMAASILATRADAPVTITGAQAVSKSYPDFFKHFQALGGSVDVQPAGR